MKKLMLALMLMLGISLTGCAFRLSKGYDADGKLFEKKTTIGWLYHSHKRFDREFHETHILRPIFKYKKDGDKSFLRIWPLYYHHLDERHLGIARHYEPGDENAASNFFSLMENSFAGQLSSLAALSILKDKYSSSVGLVHPTLFLFHAEDNQEHWPNVERAQPTGLYSILAPWWLADYLLVQHGFRTRYFPPIAGYDSGAKSFKFLNLYCGKRGFNLHPLLGCAVGEKGYFYLWPLYRVAKEDGKFQTSTLWGAFRNGVWSEPWSQRAATGQPKPEEK